MLQVPKKGDEDAIDVRDVQFVYVNLLKLNIDAALRRVPSRFYPVVLELKCWRRRSSIALC